MNVRLGVLFEDIELMLDSLGSGEFGAVYLLPQTHEKIAEQAAKKAVEIDAKNPQLQNQIQNNIQLLRYQFMELSDLAKSTFDHHEKVALKISHDGGASEDISDEKRICKALLKKYKENDNIPCFYNLSIKATINVKDQSANVFISQYESNGVIHKYLRKTLEENTTNIANITTITTRLFENMLTGMYQMHEAGVLHLDIAMRNTLVNSKGEAVLADYGLSHGININEQSYVTLRESATKRFPIRHHNAETIQTKTASRISDLYSLKLTMLEMIASVAMYASGYTEDDILSILIPQSIDENGREKYSTQDPFFDAKHFNDMKANLRDAILQCEGPACAAALQLLEKLDAFLTMTPIEARTSTPQEINNYMQEQRQIFAAAIKNIHTIAPTAVTSKVIDKKPSVPISRRPSSITNTIIKHIDALLLDLRESMNPVNPQQLDFRLKTDTDSAKRRIDKIKSDWDKAKKYLSPKSAISRLKAHLNLLADHNKTDFVLYRESSTTKNKRLALLKTVDSFLQNDTEKITMAITPKKEAQKRVDKANESDKVIPQKPNSAKNDPDEINQLTESIRPRR